MRCAGVDVQLGRHPGTEEPGREVDVLVAEHIDRSDHDGGRGQAAQVLGPGRSRVDRDIAGVGGAAEIGPPAEHVGILVPDRCGEGARHVGVAIVDHRVDQQLMGDGHLTAVAGEQGQAGRQSAAGAGSPDDQAVKVDAQLAGVANRPEQPGVAVLQGRGVGSLGRQPVFDRDHHAVELFGPAVEPRVVGEGGAEHVAAAMDPVQTGQVGAGVLDGVDPQGDVGLAVGSGHDLVAIDGLRRGQLGARHVGHRLPQFGQIRKLKGPEVEGTHGRRGQKLRHLWVQFRVDVHHPSLAGGR